MHWTTLEQFDIVYLVAIQIAKRGWNMQVISIIMNKGERDLHIGMQCYDLCVISLE